MREIEIFDGLGMLSAIVAVCMVLVVVAIFVDLASGWTKAKQRGEARTSYAFSRTFTKLIQREGLLIIGGVMDVFIHFAWWFFADEKNYCVPLTTLLFAIVVCAVEAWSVKEKAEDKDRKRIDRALQTIVSVVGKEKAVEVIEEILKRKGERDDGV